MATSATAEGMDECAMARELFASSIVCWTLQILLTAIFTGSIICLGLLQRKSRLLFHRNFNILLFNSIFVSLLMSCCSALLYLLYFLSNWTNQQQRAAKCTASSFLPPFWLVILTRLPVYVHFLAMPLFQLGIMFERVRATLTAKSYEMKRANKFNIFALATIWSAIAIYSIFIVWTAGNDKKWILSSPIVYPNLGMNTDSNSPFITYLHFALCAVVVLSLATDAWIILYNQKVKKRQKRATSVYTLSHKFQVNENILSMQLMLPLDICYFCLFATHIAFSMYLRSMLDSTAQFALIQRAYDWVNLLYNIYGIICVCLYARFLHHYSKSAASKIKQNESALMTSAKNEADAHFKQLKAQWTFVERHNPPC